MTDISIVLPKPSVEVKFDFSQTELLADWQRNYCNGTDGDGFEAYLNTFSATKNFCENKISNYYVLINLASESVVKQITEIANAVRVITTKSWLLSASRRNDVMI